MSQIMHIRILALWIIIFTCLGLSAFQAQAGELQVYVKDQESKNVEDAILLIAPTDTTKSLRPKPPKEFVDQIDKEFVPHVKPVFVGSIVNFPNKDNIRHHVYSVSHTKTFELPLYSGIKASPVLFDTPGVVVLGCNIHDWMLAYIYVSDTPIFSQTQLDGIATVTDLPAGEYLLRLWHPGMGISESDNSRRVTIGESGTVKIEWQTTLKPVLKIPRTLTNQGVRYR